MQGISYGPPSYNTTRMNITTRNIYTIPSTTAIAIAIAIAATDLRYRLLFQVALSGVMVDL